MWGFGPGCGITPDIELLLAAVADCHAGANRAPAYRKPDRPQRPAVPEMTSWGPNPGWLPGRQTNFSIFQRCFAGEFFTFFYILFYAVIKSKTKQSFFYFLNVSNKSQSIVLL